ncbi:DUF4880 domain-containing protein [Sphingomonadaceae bacterium jetA1]|jgi:transmembrane sensor|uniref:FecR family protein n=1 Tax=Facivitalis istanbulensis TaxID=3075838 RepID=UPI00347D1662
MEDDAAAAGSGLKDQAVDWLVALDGGTADERAFEDWRSADPRHAAAFAQVAATWRRTADPRLATMIDRPGEPDMARPAEPVAPPAPFVAPPAAPATMVTRRVVAGGAMAAMFGLGVTGALVAWPRRSYAETAIGEQRTIKLPDGSSALLNTDTRLAWRFEDARDFWIERGEATLLVRPGARPFRVYSTPIDARLGDGRFDLRIDADGGRLLVLAGQAAATGGTMAQTMGAGTMLTVSGEQARVAPLSADAMAAATAWQSGRIVFNGMALGHAVAEFNRYLARKIALQDPGLADIPLGGTFRIADPDSFLFALHEGFGIAHRREGDRIMLYRQAG